MGKLGVPSMQLSIVIPVRNEAEAIIPVVDGILAQAALPQPFEIVVVDDGSSDGTVAAVRQAQATRPALRLVRHETGSGKSGAVHTGVRAARAPIVCTIDGDGQNPPDELPKLVAPLFAPGSDAIGLVAGQRVRHQHNVFKRLASPLANGVRRWMLKDNTRDTACAMKAFRRDAYLDLPFFENMHRFLPALFARDGWEVVHVDVTELPRASGKSKYTNFGRLVAGIYDLLGVMWLVRRRKKSRILPEG
jgi:dolichol-phosphate mannosyltransferase